jgi:hypothetical protein
MEDPIAMRLWKYWVRHGFAVAAVAPTMEALEALRAKVRAAGGPRECDTARAPSDALERSGRTLEELCAHIETMGYVESDDYGNETGFAIVGDDFMVPTFDADRDTYALDADHSCCGGRVRTAVAGADVRAVPGSSSFVTH